MTIYIQYEFINRKEINSKKLKKMLKNAFSPLPVEFSKVLLIIDKFDLYSVEINALCDEGEFKYDVEDRDLLNATKRCIEGITENFSYTI